MYCTHHHHLLFICCIITVVLSTLSSFNAAVTASDGVRRSPSQWAAHFTSSRNISSHHHHRHRHYQDGLLRRVGHQLGSPETSITRTAGTNCKQTPGSTVTCDMCCNGKCCEDPQYWPSTPTPATASLANAQAWIPLKFAFVVPSSYNTASLPSVATQKSLVGKVNAAFSYFPLRVLYKSSATYANDALWGHCATDPCYSNPSCGFVTTLIPAVTTNVDGEIVVIVCHGISYLGEAQFPWAAPSFQYVQIQLAGFSGPALVHELGHHFGLFHTFEGNCNDQGDWVSDTNVAKSSSTSCSALKDSCTSHSGYDNVDNYMNYGLNWLCGLVFTSGQSLRARRAMETYRPTLVHNTRVVLESGGTYMPACTTKAEDFGDCWCKEPNLDPYNWCKTVAPGGLTYTMGPTPSPLAGAGKVEAVMVMVVWVFVVAVSVL